MEKSHKDILERDRKFSRLSNAGDGGEAGNTIVDGENLMIKIDYILDLMGQDGVGLN